MNAGKKLLVLAVVVALLSWGTAEAQQRISEQDAGNPCKIAQVVGRYGPSVNGPPAEPYDDVKVEYDQPLTDIWSMRSQIWAVGAIGKASASIGLGPDGCRSTPDDLQNPSDYQVYNTRRDARCPTASSMFLDDEPYGWFYAAVGHGDRYSDFPTGEGIDATDVIGLKVELGTTADPNTVHVTRALIGTDKIYWDVDMLSDAFRMIPGQIANDGSVVGRMDDFDYPGGADNVIWRHGIETTIASSLPWRVFWPT